MTRRPYILVLLVFITLWVLGTVQLLTAESGPAATSEDGVEIRADDEPTFTATATNTMTPPFTPTSTGTPTITNTPTNTHTSTPANTETPSPTHTGTPAPIFTPTDTGTPTPTLTPTKLTPTNTKTPNPTFTPTSTSTPVNLAPRLDLNGSGSGRDYDTFFLVGSEVPKRIVGEGLTIVDPDSPRMSSATIKITKNFQDGSAEKLSVKTLDTNIKIDDSTPGELRLTGKYPVTDYERVLRTATYQNTASAPHTLRREIEFVVNDGEANSNRPISKVTLVDPAVQVSKKPQTQTVAKGAAAVFTIEILNIGNVALDVELADAQADGCDRTSILNLQPGSQAVTVSCWKETVDKEFTNMATVTAEDTFGHIVSDSDTARVEIENPNIEILKEPATQTVLRGEDAAFE